MVKVAELEGFSLFNGLARHELEAMAGLATRREYRQNEIIFTPDDCTTDVYILEDTNDAVQMEIPSRDGSPNLVVHTLSKGEPFAWSPLCRPYVRSTLARAIQPCTIIVINGDGLNRIMGDNEHIGSIVMKNLAGVLALRLAYVTVVLGREVQRLRESAGVRQG